MSSAGFGSSGARYQVHCVVATGFCSTAPIPYWIVKYSWSSWGEGGYLFSCTCWRTRAVWPTTQMFPRWHSACQRMRQLQPLVRWLYCPRSSGKFDFLERNVWFDSGTFLRRSTDEAHIFDMKVDSGKCFVFQRNAWFYSVTRFASLFGAFEEAHIVYVKVALHALFALGMWTVFLGLVFGSRVFGDCLARGVQEQLDVLGDDVLCMFPYSALSLVRWWIQLLRQSTEAERGEGGPQIVRSIRALRAVWGVWLRVRLRGARRILGIFRPPGTPGV